MEVNVKSTADKTKLKVLEVGENTENEILVYFGQNRENFLRDIKILREWLKQQPHIIWSEKYKVDSISIKKKKFIHIFIYI